MCTVVIRVPSDPSGPTRVLAIRDEDPGRPWDPLGQWWPARPGLVGVRDRRAGGAWLAAHPDTGRLAVLLNRVEPAPPGVRVRSRGQIVIEAATSGFADPAPPVPGFNLVEVDDRGARVRHWDGRSMRTVDLAPGTHMVAHDDVDDARSARIERWRAAFADAGTEGTPWWEEWMTVLARSAVLSPGDDRALVRDNRAHGYPTLSLLVCVASIQGTAADVAYGALDRPGDWNRPALVPPVAAESVR